MLDLLLLLLFAKMQDHVYEEAPAWKWALACSVVIVGKSWILKSAGIGAETTLVAVVMVLVMLFFYAWGYFALLRQVGDSLLLWLLVFFGGAILPFLLSVWAITQEIEKGPPVRGHNEWSVPAQAVAAHRVLPDWAT